MSNHYLRKLEMHAILVATNITKIIYFQNLPRGITQFLTTNHGIMNHANKAMVQIFKSSGFASTFQNYTLQR